jgi:tripartite-type tricarboxylate transporter receptor subunit TctC
MNATRRRSLLSITALLGAALTNIAGAQDFPSKPITLVVPFAPGGPADVVARALGERLTASMGKPVVIDNRAGAAGNIGALAVVRAPADGYTLLLTLDSSLTANAELYGKRMGFDPATELKPIATLGRYDQMLAVNPKTGITTMAQFVDAARKGMNYASAGIGSPGHLTMEGLQVLLKSKLNPGPSTGAAPAVTDLLGGQVETAFVVTPAVAQYVKSGQLTALAVSGRKRSALAPDVPTIAEAGYAGAGAEFAYVLLAPAALPLPLLRQLSGETQKALTTGDLADKFAQMDVTVVKNTPDEAAAELAKTRARWADVIKTQNIKAE